MCIRDRAYTASMLSFMLRGISVPVVLTGSQYPIAYPDSDGRKNLANALLAARELPGGVYICFGNAIIKGCRAVKTRTTSLDAFESINYPYVGMVANGRCYTLVAPEQGTEFAFSDALDPRVALIKLVPGTSPALLESLLASDMRGVVVEAFGLGGMHNFRRDHTESIKKLIAAGIPVAVSYTHLDVYKRQVHHKRRASLPQEGSHAKRGCKHHDAGKRCV